jgi:hypothetical protein
MRVDFSIVNQLATPAIHAAALANRPAAGQVGRIFIDTDNPSTGIYRDTGTTWIKIGAPSSPEADTLQTVTDRGNTTTQSVTIGAGTIPVGTIDVRRATAALNNSNDRAIIGQSTPTIPAGASFGVHNVSVVEGGLVQTYQGSATIANTGINAAGIFVNSITLSSAAPRDNYSQPIHWHPGHRWNADRRIFYWIRSWRRHDHSRCRSQDLKSNQFRRHSRSHHEQLWPTR